MLDIVTNEATNVALSTIDTIEGDKISYTQQQIIDAENTKQMQNLRGLTTKSMMQVIDTKMMDNCPINRQSIKDALSVFGPIKPKLEGKTTRKG